MSAVVKKFLKYLKSNKAEFGSASEEHLQEARKHNFPEELLNFYSICEPVDCFEGVVRIWPISHAIVENTGAIPGCALHPCGYIVFASTYCGDSYCIDTNVTGSLRPICLYSHDLIHEESSASDVEKYRFEVASSFDDFLSKFMDESLVEELDYEKILRD